MFDTGSSTFWVYDKSSSCNGCPSRSNSYKSSKSDSFYFDDNLPKPEELNYALGYVKGQAAYDDFCVVKSGDGSDPICLNGDKKLQFLNVNSAS